MARPRTAPTDLGFCAVHGPVTARKHASGTHRDGRPRITWRCLDCHDASNHHGADVPTSLGFCGAESTQGDAMLTCRRPHGHPPDLHVSADGKMWPARAEVESI